jgi:uncharacterized protein YbaP (TraB family)
MSPFRTYIILLLSAMLLPSAILAQANLPNTEKSLLWEITGKKLKAPSYIYGTVHVIPADDFIITEKVQEKMRLAGQLVMERDHSSNPFSGGFTMITAMGGMMLTPPQSLRTLVGEEEYPYLKRFISDSLHLNVNTTNAMKPFYVSQQIAQHYCMTGNTRSYESYFADQFERMYKDDVIGLETIELQRQYLDSIPLGVQTREMLNNVHNPRVLCEGYTEMIAMYKAGDIEGLYQFAVRDQDANGYMTILLDHRNAIWLPKLEQCMKKNSCFIAVGVAHLGGTNGLLQLLRNQGYTVRPVMN